MNLKEAKITQCIVHRVGNKVRNEKLELSELPINITDENVIELEEYFLKPFTTIGESHRFHNEIDVKMNEVYSTADKIFEGGNFVKYTSDIAKHLYQQTRHHSIKPGDLFITTISDILFEESYCQALGIFKAERKDNFLQVKKSSKGFNLGIGNGISKQKLDKGCIILEDDYHKGYKVFVFEYKDADTDYWRNDFLSIIPRKDEYLSTKNFMEMCKDYVTNELPTVLEVSRAEQIDLLNQSLNYFKNHTDFESVEFGAEVLQSSKLIKSFSRFKDEKRNEYQLGKSDEFHISPQAVKRQAKIYKSILKLDKNFHIYIHGNRDLIEKGFDDKKKKHFYKIFFDIEH